MKDYILSGNVFIDATSCEKFGYSDGDEMENSILETINKATDKSVGSEDLIEAIKDWPTLYHLHPKRVNLLRPFEKFLKQKSILEIGCGCGAITRYLGEVGGKVTALEGSLRRAQITAARCSDLSNVEVFCDNFQLFETNKKYDVITLIGVLEYSNIYVSGDNPVRTMLGKVLSHLAPGGVLLIAIENKLGLKYWAGAPEDHTGQPYLGIENRYSSTTAITFGKKELDQELKKGGFTNTNFLYPFPDYKLPDAIVTGKGLETDQFNVPMLLLEDFEYVQSAYYSSHFSTTLVAAELDRNGLLADFSNSFLVIASPTSTNILPSEILALKYNSGRKKTYQKSSSFVTDNGTIRVIRNRLYGTSLPSGGEVTNALHEEPYFKGRLLLFDLVRIVAQESWTMDSVAAWGRKYYEILKDLSIENDNGTRVIDGKYFDLTPFNIILDEQHRIKIFDQEWIHDGALPLGYLLFRGLNYSLGAISFFNIPASGVPEDILELTCAIYRQMLPLTTEMVDQFRDMEVRNISGIGLGSYIPFSHASLKLRKEPDLERQLWLREQKLNDMKSNIEQMQTRLAQANHDNFLKDAELEAFRHMSGKAQPTFPEIDRITAEVSRLADVIVLKANQPEIADAPTLATTDETIRSLNREISELQKNITWYKNTYEDRSFLGVIKQKIASKLAK